MKSFKIFAKFLLYTLLKSLTNNKYMLKLKYIIYKFYFAGIILTH